MWEGGWANPEVTPHGPHRLRTRQHPLDRDLDGQLARLKAEGCGIIRAEKVSGGSREGRAEVATFQVPAARRGVGRHPPRLARARHSGRLQRDARGRAALGQR